MFFRRLAEAPIQAALADTPVVFLVGPRRSGKTTLAKKITGERYHYLTLDHPTTLRAAIGDPVQFLRGLDYVVIDEVQRAPDLLLVIKKSVDEYYRPGRFLLTGSANVLTLPKVADSLAGRVEVVTLLPLAQCEIEKRRQHFFGVSFQENGTEASLCNQNRLVRIRTFSHEPYVAVMQKYILEKMNFDAENGFNRILAIY